MAYVPCEDYVKKHEQWVTVKSVKKYEEAALIVDDPLFKEFYEGYLLDYMDTYYYRLKELN